MSAQLDHYYRKRKMMIQLLGNVCVDCGSNKSLEFDHVDRSKKSFNISQMYGWSLERILPELSKCVLRCKSCHLKKTKYVDGIKAEHGKYSMYRHHKCRCDLCKEANRKSVADWRKSKRDDVNSIKPSS